MSKKFLKLFVFIIPLAVTVYFGINSIQPKPPKPEIEANGRFINFCPKEIKYCNTILDKVLLNIDIKNSGNKSAENISVDFPNDFSSGLYLMSDKDSFNGTSTEKFDRKISIGNLPINDHVNLFIITDVLSFEPSKMVVSFEGGKEIVNFP